MELRELLTSYDENLTDSRVQRLFESRHFHYPYIELGEIEIHINPFRAGDGDITINLIINSNGFTWTTSRSLEEFIKFDTLLHRCVFERRFSKLEEIIYNQTIPIIQLETQFSHYATRLTQLLQSQPITCNSLLEFFEMDYRGKHFKSIDEQTINCPAVAAAIVTKAYIPKKRNHLTLKIGDMIAICEMTSPNQDETTLWRGKLTISVQPEMGYTTKLIDLDVGYFPSGCVRLIDKNRINAFAINVKRYGLRRPFYRRSRTNVLRDVIRKRDPIFGTDLTEHLKKSDREIPLILEQCTGAIEKLGLVTGIYRQCGVQSNIKRLRSKYDSGDNPDLLEFGSKDIYSVSSLLKQYFRQLPIPLFTNKFCQTISKQFDGSIKNITEDEMKQALQLLPSTHYATARFLMIHLNKLLEYSSLTDMTVKALAIVWAPNLYRTSSDQETDILNSLSAHTNMCSYLIWNAKSVFLNDFRDSFIFSNDHQLPEVSKEASFGTFRISKVLALKNKSDVVACWKDQNIYETNKDLRSAKKSDSLRLLILKSVDDLRERLNLLSFKDITFRHRLKYRLENRDELPTQHSRLEPIAEVSTTELESSANEVPIVSNHINYVQKGEENNVFSTNCYVFETSSDSIDTDRKNVSFSTVASKKEKRITFKSPQDCYDRAPRWTESYVVESETDSESEDRDSPTLEMSRYDNVDLVVSRKSLRRF